MVIKEIKKKVMSALPGKTKEKTPEEDTLVLPEKEEVIDTTPAPPTKEEQEMNLDDLTDTYRQLVHVKEELLLTKKLNNLKQDRDIVLHQMAINKLLKTMKKFYSDDQIEEITADAEAEVKL